MYIEPNSTIKICKNVPLDNTYKNTLYFANKLSQENFFTSKTKHNLAKQSYQRVVKGKMRVEIKSEDLYDCNYLCFQNTSFGLKWFYCFITDVEYVNNETSEITFEIDVMQTYFFDTTLKECFVEREHSATDNIGDNILPEPVDVGEYIFNDYTPLDHTIRDFYIVVAIVDVKGGSQGELYDGIYSGAELWVFKNKDVQGVDKFLDGYSEKPESVISIYMVPKILISGNIPDGGMKLPYGEGAAGANYDLQPINGTELLDGYTPRNKKLYTYPYHFLSIDNASGSSLCLRYEFFNNLTPSLMLRGCITQPVSIVLYLRNYKNFNTLTGEYIEEIHTESLSLTSYPVCSWNNDSFTQFLGKEGFPLIVKNLASMGVGNEIGAITNTLTSVYKASVSADVMRGSLNNGNVNCANNRQQFYTARCSVNKHYAKAIDDYFTMFGYTCKRVKVPGITNRSRWNYVKTKNCCVQSNAPVDDVKKICEIYDAGITFWITNVSDFEVGNYNFDNTPTGSGV